MGVNEQISVTKRGLSVKLRWMFPPKYMVSDWKSQVTWDTSGNPNNLVQLIQGVSQKHRLLFVLMFSMSGREPRTSIMMK